MSASTRPGSVPEGIDPHARPTAQLVKDVLSATQTLFRQELELARLELSETVATKAQAAGAGGAAAVFSVYLLGFLGLAGGYALAEVVAPWLAFLVVAGVFLVLAVVALLIARSRAKARGFGAEKTKQSIQEDIAWARRLTRR